MDVLTSIHPLPGQWLNRSDLADIAPLYIRRLASLGYACNTQRTYLLPRPFRALEEHGSRNSQMATLEPPTEARLAVATHTREQCDDARQCGAAAATGSAAGSAQVSGVAKADHISSHDSSHDGDAFATSGCRHHGHCALAWPRTFFNQSHVRRGRPGDERACTVPIDRTGSERAALPPPDPLMRFLSAL